MLGVKRRLTSDKWVASPFRKKPEGQAIAKPLYKDYFWKGVEKV